MPPIGLRPGAVPLPDGRAILDSALGAAALALPGVA